MKVLVATKETQGGRSNDFCFTDEGEFVMLPTFECTGEKVDDECGCKRAFSGLSTHKSTTTAKVVNKQIKAGRFVQLVVESLTKAGWLKAWDDVPAWAIRSAITMLDIADDFPVGTIVERRENVTIRLRK